MQLPDSFEWQYYLTIKNIQINVVTGGYRLSFFRNLGAENTGGSDLSAVLVIKFF